LRPRSARLLWDREFESASLQRRVRDEPLPPIGAGTPLRKGGTDGSNPVPSREGSAANLWRRAFEAVRRWFSPGKHAQCRRPYPGPRRDLGAEVARSHPWRGRAPAWCPARSALRPTIHPCAARFDNAGSRLTPDHAGAAPHCQVCQKKRLAVLSEPFRLGFRA